MPVFSTSENGLVPKSTARTDLTHYLTPAGKWKPRHMPIIQGEDKAGTGWILIAQLTFVYGYNDMINIFEVVGRINHHARLYIRGNGASAVEDTTCAGFYAEGIEVQDNRIGISASLFGKF